MEKSSYLPLLPLMVQGHRFAFTLTEVERLLPLAEVQWLPQMPPFIIGLVTIEEEPVVMIDFAGRLGLEMHREYTIEQPVILLCSGERRGAVVVDEVSVVETIKEHQVRGAELFRSRQTPVKGMVNLRAGPTLLMDAAQLIAVDLEPELAPLTLGEDLRAICSPAAEDPPS
ncbi:MAG: chemotaxis protein CheW [Gammaproteobacteria bacterium]|nr:chemotaxis protein CheW [Gammaproteobacteria bacterium]